LRRATGTPAIGAHINAQTNAHIIFPRTFVTSEMTRKSFCQLRKSFCLEAQVIFDEAPTMPDPELPPAKRAQRAPGGRAEKREYLEEKRKSRTKRRPTP
jgi:hypothetical protein